MRRSLLAAVLLVVALSFASRASAQSPFQTPAATPAPTSVPVASIAPDVTDDSNERPWGRLAIFVPVSVAIGAGAVYGRRLARNRGWTGS